MRWRAQGTISTNNRNVLYYSGDDTATHYGVELLLKAIVN